MGAHYTVTRAVEGSCSTCHGPAAFAITGTVSLKVGPLTTTQKVTIFQCEACKAELAQELSK